MIPFPCHDWFKQHQPLLAAVREFCTVATMILRRLLPCLLLLWGVAPAAEQSVVLISLDGFRWDYLEKFPTETPSLRALVARGVRARSLTPCFPANTFPNHYTLVTGLYPEHHGIVGNRFYDPDTGVVFYYKTASTRPTAQLWGGEPLWLTAEKQGLRAGCMFWPGSDVPIGGRRPSYWFEFDQELSPEKRVDQILAWLDLPEDRRPRMLTLYFEQVDVASHRHGLDSPGFRAAVRLVDAMIGRLTDGLAARRLADAMNLVVVSDHGMLPTSAERIVFLDDYIAPSEVQVDFQWSVVGLRPLTGTAEDLLKKLTRLPHARVYAKAALPRRFHFRDSPRIPPVVILAEAGWLVISRETLKNRTYPVDLAAHGFDPALPEMGAAFIAAGPAFRQGATLKRFDNIHVYNLLCAVLGLQPAPNDGDNRLVRAALRRP